MKADVPGNGPPGTVASRRGVLVLVLALLAVTAAVRLWHLDHGLPHYPHVDEAFTMMHSLRIVSGNLNTRFYDWPGTPLFHFDALLIHASILTGFWRDPTDLTKIFVLARMVSVLCALGTVFLVFALLRETDALAAGVAALVVALSPLHVQESIRAMTDVPATLLLVAVLCLSSRIVEDPGGRRCFWAGFLLGLGTAIKYYVIVGAVAGTLAVLLAPGTWKKKGGLLGLAVLAACLGFLLGCPWSVLAYADFREDFVQQIRHQADGHLGADAPYWTHLVTAVGLPALLGAGIGALLVLRPAQRRYWPVLATGAAYFLLASLSRVSFPRYAIPHVPILAILVGVLIASLPRPWLVPAGVAAALLAVPAGSTYILCRDRAKRDTREAAIAWLKEHKVPHKETVRTGYGPFLRAGDLISPFEDVPEHVQKRTRAEAYTCAVIDSWSTEMFFTAGALASDSPKLERHRRYYGWVREHWVPVARFAPGPELTGPLVEIYAPPRTRLAGGPTYP